MQGSWGCRELMGWRLAYQGGMWFCAAQGAHCETHELPSCPSQISATPVLQYQRCISSTPIRAQLWLYSLPLSHDTRKLQRTCATPSSSPPSDCRLSHASGVGTPENLGQPGGAEVAAEASLRASWRPSWCADPGPAGVASHTLFDPPAQRLCPVNLELYQPKHIDGSYHSMHFLASMHTRLSVFLWSLAAAEQDSESRYWD